MLKGTASALIGAGIIIPALLSFLTLSSHISMTTAVKSCETPEEWLAARHGNKSGIKGSSFAQGQKWSKGRVPYTLDKNLENRDLPEIQKAFDEYHKKTCIRFVPKGANDPDWINIQNDSTTCGLANVCRSGGYQFAKFGSDCKTAATMIHELGHGLCLGHEQSRPDRDNFLDFTGHGCQPAKLDSRNDVLGTMYDYTSQMHYQCSFCAGGFPTNPSTINCGDDVQPGLSVLDVNRINEFYNCPGCLSYRFKNFQYLTAAQTAAAFPAGSDPDAGITTTYACRSYNPDTGDIIPGNFDMDTLTCSFVYDGVGGSSTGGDVLTNPSGANLVWVGSNGRGIPGNAIASGRLSDGTVLYIARGKVDGTSATVAGTVSATQPNQAYINYDNEQKIVSDFEILVCQE